MGNSRSGTSTWAPASRCSRTCRASAAPSRTGVRDQRPAERSRAPRARPRRPAPPPRAHRSRRGPRARRAHRRGRAAGPRCGAPRRPRRWSMPSPMDATRRPRSAHGYLATLEDALAGIATIATVSGRYYAMDRDRRWERDPAAYDAIVDGRGERAASAAAAIASAYAADCRTSSSGPTVIGNYAGTARRRRRRAHELPRRPGEAAHPGPGARRTSMASTAARGRETSGVTTLTEYQAPDELPVAVAFPPLVIDSLAAELSRRGPAPAPRRRDGEVRPRHVLLQRRSRGGLARARSASSCRRTVRWRRTTRRPR